MVQQLLLTLDTSGSHLTMGLYGPAQTGENLAILAESTLENDSQRYHSSMLMPSLTSLFKQANKTLKDLTDLAIHIGPGSFTGIRTGLISARTLGQFLPVRAYAINAFELAVFTAFDLYSGKPVCVALDARRGRAYTACGRYRKTGFEWTSLPCLSANDEITATYQNIVIIANQSLFDALPVTQSLESLYVASPASRQMARIIHAQPQAFQRPWQALIPLYLEEPNITLPKRNPAIISSNLYDS